MARSKSLTPTEPVASASPEGDASADAMATGLCHMPPDATPVGYADEKSALLRRLRRIEGQVRGIERMVEADAYCIDVLTQVAAATSALRSVSILLLEDHMHSCVRSAVESDRDAGAAKIDEALAAVERLIKS